MKFTLEEDFFKDMVAQKGEKKRKELKDATSTNTGPERVMGVVTSQGVYLPGHASGH